MKTKHNRLEINNISPSINNGQFPIKRIVGDSVLVQADILVEGHIKIGANLLWKNKTSRRWNRLPMELIGNDRWECSFTPDSEGVFEFTIEAWADLFGTWIKKVIEKIKSNTYTSVDLDEGLVYLKSLTRNKRNSPLHESLQKIQSTSLPSELIELIGSLQLPSTSKGYIDSRKLTTCNNIYRVIVKRKKAQFSSWYEIFPRSCSRIENKHGTFKDVIELIPEIAEKGFDVLYFPPIHPIGHTHRKGRNNSVEAKPNDPGSPWAIGSRDGGHKSIHSELGTLADYRNLIKAAENHGVEIAMDLAFQCSPDHPYIKEHPEWFKWRSDGTIQYAENPPKKYEDIVPFDFDCQESTELWEELYSIVDYWVNQGVKIFRVDNPHTKPFSFWAWLIEGINANHPDVLFLSEAFTRPKVMNQLALLGFDQSYTYFTWRNTKQEIIDYMNELTQIPSKDYFRPNFWPNTPDILPEILQSGKKAAFISRFILAATLSSNYGIYAPAFELCEYESIGREEYLNSEKYEIRSYDSNPSESISTIIKRVNEVRHQFSSLQTTWNIEFCETENDNIIAYIKYSQANDPHLLIVVNLDPVNTHEGLVHIPLDRLDIEQEARYMVHDLLDGEEYLWSGNTNYIKLDPNTSPAHIFIINSQAYIPNQIQE